MTWQERVARDQRERAEVSGERRKKTLWSARHRAIVTHPDFGEVEVPCHSPLAAMECAAELWGVAYRRIAKEGKVKAVDS